MNDKNTELKPCPFCGSIPVINETSTHNYPNYYSVGYNISCPGCHIYFGSTTEIEVVNGLPIVNKNGYQECIDQWNRRAPYSEIITGEMRVLTGEGTTGYWIKEECSEKDGDARCSICGHRDWSDRNYCSECGCGMEGVSDD